jgi:hypothetical protein
VSGYLKAKTSPSEKIIMWCFCDPYVTPLRLRLELVR